MGGVSPGSIANRMPPAEDDQARKARDLSRAQRENAAARSLEATSIGEGGLRVIGGSINIEAGGDLIVDGDAEFNGNLTVPAGSLDTAGNISAGGNLTAGATVQGASLVSTGGASVTGTITAGAVSTGGVSATGEVSGNQGTFASGLSSPGAYNTLVTGGGAYRATWQHETGYYGYAPSSRRFKTDIESFVPDAATIEALKSLRVVMFRYYARPPYDQAQQPQVVGLIAEEVHDLGLTWLVDYDDDGLPFGVRYDMLSLAMMLLWQYA